MFKMRLLASLYRFPFGGGSRLATKLARFASIFSVQKNLQFFYKAPYERLIAFKGKSTFSTAKIGCVRPPFQSGLPV